MKWSRHGDIMVKMSMGCIEVRIMTVKRWFAMGLILIAFAGVGFAMGFPGIGSWQGNSWQNASWNGTVVGHHHGARQNTTSIFQNGTLQMGRFHRNMMAGTSYINSTATQQFQQAIASGDYQTAMQLHTTYGLGGPSFGNLTQTTFGLYSQVYNLVTEINNLTGMKLSIGGQGFGFVRMPHQTGQQNATAVAIGG